MVSANALTTINNTKVHIVTATEILLKYFFKAITLKFTQAASCGSRLYIFYWLTVVNFLQFIIFTNKPNEISQRIITETCHSVTLMNGEGFYSHQNIKVLITIVHKRESVNILRMIKETDPAAFVSQSRAEGVYGNGFNAIRA